ncbi:DUF547 domain-containing protein [Gracilimonas halophila]|uniref:DUF547 domain-containing protein n=1 Tax=Gracilimonas halophila TaxID=1834464 RepID=A0ABW5JFQ7_9BACT
MILIILFGLIIHFGVPNSDVQVKQDSFDKVSYTELSMELVRAVRDGDEVEPITQRLASVSEDELYNDLETEAEKKAFRLNIYNAYVQILLLEDPELFEDRNSWFGYNFFTSPQVVIAGKELSFDDIEHGIMRRSKIKLSLGYLDQWFVDDFVKRFWWNEVDPRIHFALNCGAASCPFIAVFDPDRVDEQLDITTKNYLEQTTDYYPEENEVEVNKLMSWFRADFGGPSGAIQMLKEYDIIPENVDPSISYKEYDWTLELGNYQDI